MARYYLDTCILFDIAEDSRSSSALALAAVERLLRDGHAIVISDYHAIEWKHLGHSLSLLRTTEDTLGASGCIHVHLDKHQAMRARTLARSRSIPYGDAVHAILARDCDATIVTRDAHFRQILDVVLSVSPNDLLDPESP